MTKSIVCAVLLLAAVALPAPSAVADLAVGHVPVAAPHPRAAAKRPICQEERELLPEVGDGTTGRLPTRNAFTGTPGCYVACYTRDEHIGVYSVGDGIYAAGQYRTRGRYDARVCRPESFEQADISVLATFKEACTKLVPACDGKCWAGGDTGAALGLSEREQCQAKRSEPPPPPRRPGRHGRR